MAIIYFTLLVEDKYKYVVKYYDFVSWYYYC